MENETTYQLNMWARCDLHELKTLERLKVSGTQMRVYLVLKSFSRAKHICFPSLKTIVKALGHTSATAIQIVCRALKRLADLGLIKRNHRRSKERFVMTESKASCQKRQEQLDQTVNKRQEQEDNSYINKRKETKKRPQIVYKSHKTKHRGWRKARTYDGGNASKALADGLPAPETLFSTAVKNGIRLSPKECGILQDYIKKTPKFRDFVLAYHPKRHTEITGICPSGKEIIEAQDRITNELKENLGIL